MNRDELLKAAQAQGEKEGEYERNIYSKGVMLGSALALFSIVVMDIIEYIVFKKIDYGKPAILMLIVSSSELFCGYKIKAKKMIVLGFIYLAMFLVLLGLYIGAFLR